MLPAHAENLFPLFIVNCNSDLQMLRTLTKKSVDEAFVCWPNADGEEPLNDDAK